MCVRSGVVYKRHIYTEYRGKHPRRLVTHKACIRCHKAKVEHVRKEVSK